MEFSRLEQFQAVLVGLAVADAAVHGQIAVLKPAVAPMTSLIRPWSQSLIYVARQLNLESCDQSVADAATQDDLELALIQMPILLRYIDDSIEPCFAASEHLGLPPHSRDLTAQLHRLLTTLLKHSQNQSLSMRLLAFEGLPDNLSPQPDTAIVTHALKYALQATGDFRLAILNSLPVAEEPLLPVLVGGICTALRGLNTIPVAWRQALLPAQSSWYADRWGLSDEMALRDIATALWRSWAGL